MQEKNFNHIILEPNLCYGCGACVATFSTRNAVFFHRHLYSSKSQNIFFKFKTFLCYGCGDCELNLYKFDDEEGKDVFRHTSAHMLAQALKRLYPGVKLAIGPSIENGFYYDIDLDHRITEEELAKIEAEMKKIAKEDLKIERYELSKEDALKWAKENGEDYISQRNHLVCRMILLHLLVILLLIQLCRGPHLPSTKKLKL